MKKEDFTKAMQEANANGVLGEFLIAASIKEAGWVIAWAIVIHAVVTH